MQPNINQEASAVHHHSQTFHKSWEDKVESNMKRLAKSTPLKKSSTKWARESESEKVKVRVESSALASRGNQSAASSQSQGECEKVKVGVKNLKVKVRVLGKSAI